MGTRRIVVVGQRALADPTFLIQDMPGTSGRLDVLARSVRAGLLTSHGVRRDTVVDLVLLGGPRAPRTVRIDGGLVQFLRPDERAIGTLLQKVLATEADAAASGFVPVKSGISVARGGLEASLADRGTAALYVLEEDGPDVRDEPDAPLGDAVFVVGDHLGFTEPDRARLAAEGARPIRVGPTSLHTDDVVAVLGNELDRRAALRK